MSQAQPEETQTHDSPAGPADAAADGQPSLLETITGPADLKRLPPRQLERLAEEIRQVIIDTVRRTGGHLASNLGVAELTIALHAVFDVPRDRLLWDVGHQCYPHKLLTGRREGFDRLRQAGGPSGFPSPAESDCDLFATGHAGTAISAAAGLAWADRFAGRTDNRIVAIVGDGSIVNGAAFEAINNSALIDRQMLVILNDNSMAIDVTQGGLARLLDRLRLTRTYTDLKQRTEQTLRRVPLGQEISDALRHIHGGLRTTFHGEQIFELLGLRYFGPVDGHDIEAMIDILKLLKDVPQPVLLHVHTQKGRGC
jgi:1-deoxy-D-xylulose-5-phosphate synthase